MEKRNPKDLQALLRFALDYTKSEDASSDSLYEKMDPQRKEFLENALTSMGADVSEIQKAIIILDSEHSADNEKINALNVVRDFLDNIDCSNNFIKAGGAPTIIKCLQSCNPKIKTCALYIIAEISQNNPFGQDYFITSGILSDLITYVDEDESVGSSALQAISAIVRNLDEGCLAFMKINGIERILVCIQSKYPKVFVKACFLVCTLSSENATVRDKFVELSTIELLANYVELVPGFDIKIETVLSALCVLSETKDGQAHLKKTSIEQELRGLMQLNNNKAECEDMLEYVNMLLHRIGNVEHVQQ